ncbi:hypothetical protein [Ekhidna sp.]|jgi:hypothetical protein|uniref:hypothetical protein n=1 Tax=Ekhidna sp. TaxID=2608089 RepID=UPI0032EC1F2D
MIRPNYVTVLVGAPNTGKTTELLKLVNAIPKRALIFDLNNEEKYRAFPRMALGKLPSWKRESKSKYRIFHSEPEIVIQSIHDNLRNATLVLEDATSYMDPSTTRVIRKILVSRRHWNLDIFLTFHSLSVVPPVVFSMCNWIVLKKTNENMKKIKGMDKLPNPDELVKAWEKVNAHKDPYFQQTIRVQ